MRFDIYVTIGETMNQTVKEKRKEQGEKDYGKKWRIDDK